MSLKRFDKIKLLIKNWLPGAIMTTEMLLEQGFSYSDIQRYLGSEWIEQVGHGAYKKYADVVNWQGSIHALQGKVHIGGKSALYLSNMGHYMNLGEPQIDVFSSEYINLPLWFKNNDWKANVRHFNSNFLPEIAIDDFTINNFVMKLSSPERAALELMHFTNRVYSFNECKLLAENLTYLRPEIMQELLEKCTSIKAKRLVLYFAYSLQMGWYDKLNFNKIDLGKGYRKVEDCGEYDEKFKLMIPKTIHNEQLKF